MLNKAARALNLPARSTRSYLSLFEGRGQQIANHSSKSVVPELEQRYSGYIIVSGYSICFVLPKEFPPTSPPVSGGNTASLSRSGRRSSILGRASLQYMVALDLWVPFSSKVRLLSRRSGSGFTYDHLVAAKGTLPGTSCATFRFSLSSIFTLF